jgi:hypothetical protein
MANRASAEEIVDRLMAATARPGDDPFRGRPVAAVVGKAAALPAADDPANLPQTLADLASAESRSYDLSVTRAAELNIPVVGSVGGGWERRVVVLERVAYRRLAGGGGDELLYGYAIRLCVTVNKWDGAMKASLPFLAASAQFGQIQASWTLQVLGLSGPAIDKAQLPPSDLDVETFVLAKQSLTALIAAVHDPTTRFAAQCVATVKAADRVETELRQGVARTYALGRIERRVSVDDAIRRMSSADPLVNGAIDDVYTLLGCNTPGARPDDAAAARARTLLGGVRADV